jgi:KipI family sensor histidine kinase inhibitor
VTDGVGPPRILPMGETAWLIELPDAATTLAAYERLRAALGRGGSGAGVTDIVPAARTVLVRFDAQTPAARTTAWIRAAIATAPDGEQRATWVGSASGGAEIVEIPVRYDGPDLGEVAAVLGIDREAVVALHLAGEWVAAFIGFAPGFAYLTGDTRLTVPRRSMPRAAVPAGAVALAAGYCGVYPRESPGGWQLIGSTDRELWNTRWPQPALLAPGTRVRFVREG